MSQDRCRFDEKIWCNLRGSLVGCGQCDGDGCVTQAVATLDVNLAFDVEEREYIVKHESETDLVESYLVHLKTGLRRS